MGTYTVEQHQREITTSPFSIPAEGFEHENRMSSVLSHRCASMKYNLEIPVQIDIYDYYRKLMAISKLDPANEMLLAQFLSSASDKGDAPPQTETFFDEAKEQQDALFSPEVTVSQDVASELRAKEIHAFVPVSAADLIWLEAQSMNYEDDE